MHGWQGVNGMRTHKARRLKTLAAVINASGKYTATIERSFCNTDRKPRGFRYITHKGRGRWGNKLIVRNKKGAVVFEHDAAQTYRCNAEVEEWIRRSL